jgi:8-oxo-dGTP diphosphatase
MPASDQGIFQDRYRVIPRVLVFITQGSEVLLIKGAPDKRLWANLYNGIGGHIEQGENVLTAAYRELREETGLRGIELDLSAIISIDTGEMTGITIFVFHGEIKEGVPVELKNSEEGSLEWVNQSNMVSIPLVEDLPTLIPRILAHKTGEAPVYGLYSYTESGDLKIRFVKNQP